MKIKYKPNRQEDPIQLQVRYQGEWLFLAPEQFESWYKICSKPHCERFNYRVIFVEGKGFTYELFSKFEYAVAYYVGKVEKPTETKRVVQMPQKFLLDLITQLGDLPEDPEELNRLLEPLLKLGYTSKALNEAIEYLEQKKQK